MLADLTSKQLGTESIKKILLKLSIPTFISLILFAAHNLIDIYFVGKLNVNAISALAVSFPIYMVILATGSGTGIGVLSIVSRLLGKNQKKNAETAAGNAIVISFMYWIFTAIIGYFFAENIIRLSISDPIIVDLGADYLRILMIGSICFFYLLISEYTLRGQGKVFVPLGIIFLTISINIILDPIMIFGLFNFPALGVKGAAIATVLAQLIGCIIITFVLKSRKNELDIKLDSFRLDKEIIKGIYNVGIPSVFIQLFGSIILIITNRILESISLIAIAVYGIFYQIQAFLLTPIFALGTSFIPIVGYNFGAKKYDRIREALRYAFLTSFIITFFAFLVFQIFPGEIINTFNPDTELLTIGIPAIRIITLIYFVMGPMLIIGSFFQGIGNGLKIFIIYFVGQVIVFLPVFYFLSITFDLPLLWIAFPISNGFTSIIGLILLLPDLKKLNIKLRELILKRA